MAKLDGKTALVTGASRGIGRGIAQRLATDGALVAIHYGSNEEAAKQTVAEIEQAGGRAFSIRAELGVEGDVDILFAGLEKGLSGRPLDILVNNAAGPPGGPIEETTREAFDRIFAINVRAPFFIIQRALPILRDGGRIITISSVATRIAVPSQTSYAMTKGALEVMGHTLANALGKRNITVNTVRSGTTYHEHAALLDLPGVKDFMVSMTALGRLGSPSDIADVVAFLASDDGRWITGQVLDASGGIYLGPR
ncbi:SDR family oxidoreductase [Labilithrix luteola]|uniref:SDR family oxidoreductase n=1 Tax=Labilithrix luteola TaxID=1391654 RepID=UPI0011BA4AFA|nr:SDR family oxidoreductase [Labilithrix luteola]